MALSGQEAKFLVGGEFPIPMSTGLGAVSVQWKKFGIILNFTPDRHRGRRAAPQADDRGQRRRSGALRHRRRILDPGPDVAAERDHRPPADGQSFAIAGLLSDRVRSTIQRIPFLGDLPILGALFRSVTYQRDESELLVVVTAHLARPVSPHDAPRLPTDNELNDPNDIQLFLFGSQGAAGRRAQARHARSRRATAAAAATASGLARPRTRC